MSDTILLPPGAPPSVDGYSLLVFALWAAWAAYWFANARGNKLTVREESPASRLGHVVPLLLAAALLAVPRLPWAGLDTHLLRPTLGLYWSGVAVLLGGIVLSIYARRTIGRNWSGTVTLKIDHELVRSGPYRYVRHPIYSALLLGYLGTALIRDEWRGILALLIAYAALWRKLKLEERWMLEAFEDSYRHYRSEVPALIPKRLPLLHRA